MANNKPLVKEIIDLWCEITGMDPNDTHRSFFFDDRFNLDNAREDLKSAFKLDPEALTSVLMLDYFADRYFSSKKFSVQELMNNKKNINQLADKCWKLKVLLHDPDVEGPVTAFVDAMRNVMTQMDCNEKAFETLQNWGELGYLRRDALRSMETLRVDQFTQGTPSSDHLRFLNDIYLFWDMASVVHLGIRMPDGLFMALIKDDLDTNSYFALAAKNGGTLTVYSDLEPQPHPLAKYMSRRPERDFTRRIFRHHFPYGLMDLKVTGRGDYCPSDTSLVPLQNELIKVGKINELEPDEVLWLIMVLTMIDQKLYRVDWKLPKLSYCADMLREDSRLTGDIQNLPAVQNYKPIVIPENTVETLDLDTQYGEEKQTRRNQWLVDMYKDRVPAEVLNGLVGDQQQQLMLDTGTMSAQSMATQELNEMTYFKRQEFEAAHPKMERFNDTVFGTEEEMTLDHRFLAKVNMATAIEAMNQEDFKRHSPEVSQWLRNRVTARKDAILEMLVKREAGNWYRFADIDAWNNYGYGNYAMFYNGDRGAKARTKCWWDNGQASYVAKYTPNNMDELLQFLGLTSVEELPFWLRHWHEHTEYAGNHLLFRIDPADWAIRDRWSEWSMTFVFCLSKRTFNAACKKYGVENAWRKETTK